mgnify:CR=1 FL=1
MKFHQAILWQTDRAGRSATLALGIALLLLITYLHSLTGLAYEFHVFFLLPVLVVTWFVGLWAGCVMATLSVGLWSVTDYSLSGAQATSLPLIFNTAARLLAALVSVWLLAKVRMLLDRERRLAREDVLTRLSNRRAFFEQGRLALAQARRAGSPITAVSFDLDKFKQVNDTLGHKVGDALLVCVADTLRTHLRVSDIPVRLGGDEFALLLLGMDSAAAKVYVDQLRHHLLQAMAAHDWPVTFSIGVASYRQAPTDLDAMLTVADDLMYEAKQGSRNCVRYKELMLP